MAHRGQELGAPGAALVVVDDGPSVVLRRRDGGALASGVAGIRLPLTMAEYRRSRRAAARTMYALASSPVMAAPIAPVGHPTGATPDEPRQEPRAEAPRHLQIVRSPVPRGVPHRRVPRRTAAARDGPASTGDEPPATSAAPRAAGAVGPSDPRRPLLDLLAEAIAADLLRGGGEKGT